MQFNISFGQTVSRKKATAKERLDFGDPSCALVDEQHSLKWYGAFVSEFEIEEDVSFGQFVGMHDQFVHSAVQRQLDRRLRGDVPGER